MTHDPAGRERRRKKMTLPDAGSNSGPFAFLMKSIEELPAMKYGLGIGALVTVGAIVKGFNVNLKIAPFIAVVMLVLMVVLVVFAGLAAQSASTFRLPIQMLTWFSLILIMATGVVIFTSAFWNRPVDLARMFGSGPTIVDSRPDLLVADLKTLEGASQDPLDTWKPYVRDYSELADITVRYLHYVEGNRYADPGDKVSAELQAAFRIIKNRNGKDRTSLIQQPNGSHDNPHPEYQAETIPGMYHDLLTEIVSDKNDGLSSPRELCYETALRRLLLVNAGFWNNRTVWFVNSGFQDSPPVLSDGCRSLIQVPTGI
jgi:hypothetical protein